MAAASYQYRVFVNVPFDASYRPLLRGMVFAIYDCGYTARSALNDTDSGKVRIAKLQELIRGCRQGIHDICRAGLDKTSGLARFNMPLELGLFLGAQAFGDRHQRKKRCLILDKAKYRYQKFCSDIAGQDIDAHGFRVERVITSVRNWLAMDAGRRGVQVPGGAEMSRRYRRFRRALPAMCKQFKVEVEELTHGEFETFAVGWLKENPWG
jgi:hypothetical protein